MCTCVGQYKIYYYARRVLSQSYKVLYVESAVPGNLQSLNNFRL